jgi:hypothetical protein
MATMLTALASGVLLGLSAGLAPVPTLALAAKLAALNPHLSRRWCRNVLYAWHEAAPVRRKIQVAARKPSLSNSAASSNAPVATGNVNHAKESEQ